MKRPPTIKDPEVSLDFYVNQLGMTLVKQLDFPEMSFTLYFLGYLRDFLIAILINSPTPLVSSV